MAGILPCEGRVRGSPWPAQRGRACPPAETRQDGQRRQTSQPKEDTVFRTKTKTEQARTRRSAQRTARPTRPHLKERVAPAAEVGLTRDGPPGQDWRKPHVEAARDWAKPRVEPRHRGRCAQARRRPSRGWPPRSTRPRHDRRRRCCPRSPRRIAAVAAASAAAKCHRRRGRRPCPRRLRRAQGRRRRQAGARASSCCPGSGRRGCSRPAVFKKSAPREDPWATPLEDPYTAPTTAATPARSRARSPAWPTPPRTRPASAAEAVKDKASDAKDKAPVGASRQGQGLLEERRGGREGCRHGGRLLGKP